MKFLTHTLNGYLTFGSGASYLSTPQYSHRKTGKCSYTNLQELSKPISLRILAILNLMRMIENESVNGKKAFTVVELGMDGLHKKYFRCYRTRWYPQCYGTFFAEKLPDTYYLQPLQNRKPLKSTRRLQTSISC